LVIISIAARFAGNTGLSNKAIQNARSHPNPYLERRANFTTKLTKTGKAPQEWENDPLPPGIEKVKYPSGDFQLEACLFVPPNGREQQNPALVFFHGGFANSNAEILCCDAFMKAGFVVLAPTLRAENGGPGNFELFLGEVDDAANAVRWLAQQPFVDSERIYTFGHSVGGGISALLSLMDNVPIKHGGSSGGLYPPSVFADWKSITPFNRKTKAEVEMRLLLGNIRCMQRPHYAYLGTEDAFSSTEYQETTLRVSSQHYEII
jgi:acetyl esterase/lipase